MKNEEITELTRKLYKLTLSFPKKEPLRYKIRETADDVLRSIVVWDIVCNSNPIKFSKSINLKKEEIIFETEKNLAVIKSYLEVAKWQNWASYFDILEIEEEYDRIERDFKKEVEFLKEAQIKKDLDLSKSQKADRKDEKSQIQTVQKNKNSFLNDRQQRILNFLKERKEVQVWQIKEIFPQVSKRTLRRDFEQLLKRDIIKRVGEKNNTFYKLN
jgi:hypothetical protein